MMKAWKRCEADCWRPWNYGRVASALCFSWFPLANVWLFLASKNVWLFLLMIGNARCQNCAGWRCFGAQNCTYLNRVWLNLVSVNLGSEHPYRGLLTLLFWKGDQALDANYEPIQFKAIIYLLRSMFLLGITYAIGVFVLSSGTSNVAKHISCHLTRKSTYQEFLTSGKREFENLINFAALHTIGVNNSIWRGDITI